MSGALSATSVFWPVMTRRSKIGGATFQFLNDLRKASESAKSRAGLALLLAAFGGLVSVVTVGFKVWLMGQTP